MSYKILVVDDRIEEENYLIAELPSLLQEAGYEVLSTADGRMVYDLVWEYNPDLIILDIALDSDHDGVEICRAIRQNGSETPIILVTAVRRETNSVLRGFEAGADDYVKLPLDLREVLARVSANLPPEVLVVDDYIRIDTAVRQVWIKPGEQWQAVHFQRLQFELLQFLVVNAGRILSKTAIEDRVWGKDVRDGVLAVYIHRLRSKLEPNPHEPTYIENIKDLGYRFNGKPTRIGTTNFKCNDYCER